MRDPRPDGLSRRQLGALVWGALVSSLVRMAPGSMLPAAGGGAWLSAALSVPGVLVLGLVLGLLLSLRRPGEGLGELFCRALDPGPGRALAGVCALWLVFCGGFVLRCGGDRFVAAVYPESPIWLFAGVTLLLCLPAGLGRVRVLGRCARIVVPCLLGLFALVFLLTAPRLELAELSLPDRALVRCGTGAVPLLGTVCSGAFFLFLAGPFPPEQGRGVFYPPLLGLAGLGLALSATVTGVFGPGLAGQMDYPFFVLIRNVRLFLLLERMDALIAAVWVVSDYLLVGALLHMASAALTVALRGPGTPRRTWYVWVCAALMGAAAWLCASDAFALQELGRQIVPLADLGFAFGVLPGVLFMGRVRKKW